MSNLSHQLNKSREGFDRDFPHLSNEKIRATASKEVDNFQAELLTVFMRNEAKKLKSFLHSAQLSAIEAYKKDLLERVGEDLPEPSRNLPEVVKKAHYDYIARVNTERQRIRTILLEPTNEKL